MAKAIQKITLDAAHDIPFDKLVLSQQHVRSIKVEVSIEDLAEDIARNGLRSSFNVRPELDGQGHETGIYRLATGGRRHRALERLINQKRLAKTAGVPCIVSTADAIEVEDALAENVNRVQLHPLNRLRTFQTLSMGFKVDVSRGEHVGRIWSEWFSRPDDDRYLYGRIWDHELVSAVMNIAGNGTGDTIWKVPGLLDWATMTHNPFTDITNETTPLYASDRDVFLFLVDDTYPIEAGRLPNGEPDLYFLGFYCWNSEVGSMALGIASFYLRAACSNRNLWGVENFEEISIRHSKFAA